MGGDVEKACGGRGSRGNYYVVCDLIFYLAGGADDLDLPRRMLARSSKQHRVRWADLADALINTIDGVTGGTGEPLSVFYEGSVVCSVTTPKSFPCGPLCFHLQSSLYLSPAC